MPPSLVIKVSVSLVITGGSQESGYSTRRSLEVSGLSNSSTKDIGVSGLKLIMLSTSVSKVVKPSSLKVARECRKCITLRTEHIKRSQAPPKWLAKGMLKCHSISHWSRNLSIWCWFQSRMDSRKILSAPVKLLPLSECK